MKLRNKKTGEIRNCDLMYKGYIMINSLKDLEEWEDYEDPKGYWYIDDAGVIQIDQVLSSEINMRKSIGNYFGTKEEAEKAVEKLKAWKRLKDKGFRFYGYECTHNDGEELCGEAYFKTGKFWSTIEQDVDLLFGGEE